MADIRKNGKQYGLICAKKAPLSAPKAINVFGDDEDSDADDGTDWVKKALKAEGEKNRVKKQTRLNMQKALDEDPTIYQYDEVFDEMERTKEQGKAIKKEVKKPKYIENLLKAADRRKKEQEHRIERMVQKERDAEGAMFADKESFVTSAYRAKLEEFKKMEEEEQNMDRLEAIGDVTKQQDMSGFYRHFFHQTVDAGKSDEPHPAATTKEVNTDNESSQEIPINSNIDQDEVLPSSSASEKCSDSDEKSQSMKSMKSKKTLVKGKRSRQYRQRVVEASESESEAEEPKDKTVELPKEESSVNEKNSNEDESEPVTKKSKSSIVDQQSIKVDEVSVKEKSSKHMEASGNTLQEKKVTAEPSETMDQIKEEEKTIKVSIWEKRTVGPVFEAALQRYYARKAIRLSGS